MPTHKDKTQNNKIQSATKKFSHKKESPESTFHFVDNRPEAVAQRKLQEIANKSTQNSKQSPFQDMVNNRPQAKQAAQLQALTNNHFVQQQPLIQKKESQEQNQSTNNTGLPDNLKSGMESLSGISLDDVKVHRNSDKPSQLQAHAYAQGTDIHLGPGQEKHLPHEAWHVVQQKQGRVKPTMQMKGKVDVNDDAGLEKEADVMGAKALQLKLDDQFIMDSSSHTATSMQLKEIKTSSSPTYCRASTCSEGLVIQRLAKIEQQKSFADLGKLEINFNEPKAFYGGMTGFVRFTPVEGGEQARKIDLVQIASMKYAADPRRMDWKDQPLNDGSGKSKPVAIEGSDDREGINTVTSGGSVIKDAMRTGNIDRDRRSPDFHIDKVYDGEGTLPGQENNNLVRDPAYNADRRQDKGGNHPLAKLDGLNPRTEPGKNWDGEIKPTTLIDSPRSPTDPIIAEFETTVMGDNKYWASVEWGFETEYNIREAGLKVRNPFAKEIQKGATNKFKRALHNYDDIVRSNGDTSDSKLEWLKENQKNRSYPDEYEKSAKAFNWALGKLTQSVEQTLSSEDREISDQQAAALRYLVDMINAAKRFLELPLPKFSNKKLMTNLQQTLATANSLK